MDYKDRFNLWLANVPETDPLHAQLLELQEHEDQKTPEDSIEL